MTCLLLKREEYMNVLETWSMLKLDPNFSRGCRLLVRETFAHVLDSFSTPDSQRVVDTLKGMSADFKV